MHRPSAKQRGLALVAVLWVSVVLSLLGAATVNLSRGDLQLAQNLIENAEAELAANSAVRLTAAGIVGGSLPWPPDPEPTVRTIGGARVVVRVEDEMARIDLNAADPALLAALMVALGAPDRQAARLSAAIADYRDPDSLRRYEGAEDDDYAAAGLTHGAADAAFADPEELRNVLGMPPGMVSRMAPYLTTLTGQAEPSGGASEALGQALSRYRTAEAKTKEFETLASGQRERTKQRLLVLPAGSSGGFLRRLVRISADARTSTGARFIREAVFDLRSTEPQILVELWRRGRSPSDDR